MNVSAVTKRSILTLSLDPQGMLEDKGARAHGDYNGVFLFG